MNSAIESQKAAFSSTILTACLILGAGVEELSLLPKLIGLATIGDSDLLPPSSLQTDVCYYLQLNFSSPCLEENAWHWWASFPFVPDKEVIKGQVPKEGSNVLAGNQHDAEINIMLTWINIMLLRTKIMLVRINVLKARINIILVRTLRVRQELLEPEQGIPVPVGAVGLLSLFQHSEGI